MPNPTQSDLHVNVPLTNVSVAYIPKQSDYIATDIFPKVPVQKQSDIFWKYSKSDWRRTDVVRRAPGTESAGVNWNLTTDTYYAEVFAVHKDIDDQVRANADSNFNLESDATKFITNQLLLKRELDFVGTHLASTSGWATTYTGVASGENNTSSFRQWNDVASDPLGDIARWVINFRQLTGYAPNTLVLGPYVMNALKNHPDLIDRIKYTQRGIVTEDLVQSLTGIAKVKVMWATQTAVAQINDTVTQDQLATYAFISDSAGKSAWLGYSAPGPSLMEPTAGYTFTWNGYLAGNSEGIRIKSFRMEHLASDRIEGEMTYALKQVASDMGVYIASPIA